MFSWQWEDFEDIIRSYAPIVNDHGPLAGPIHRFIIQRSTDLSIRMETEISGVANEPSSPHSPGTVRVNDDSITFYTEMGLDLKAIGIEATSLRWRAEGIAPVFTKQKVKIHRLVGRFPNSIPPQYAIDWLENFPTQYLWPDMIKRKTSGLTSVTLGEVPSGSPILEMKGSSASEGGSWAAAWCEIDGVRLYLCNLEKMEGTNTKSPGCIIYTGLPTDEFRDKVRRCFSYALGTYLVYLGVSRFDCNWHLTDFEAISPYSMRGQAMMLPPMPPSPLGVAKGFWGVNQTTLSHMVNALYAKYDELNLGVVSWAYWHAVTATPHIAAVHFGAAIESLSRAFLNSSSMRISPAIVGEDTWRKIRDALESCLASLELPKNTHQVFESKIRQLNWRSQHSTSKDLMNELGLVLSDRERQAHNARHRSAHGKDDEVDIEWIRNLKLLRVLFHRMLLAMTHANGEYYDWFTVADLPPIRKVTEPVPD